MKNNIIYSLFLGLSLVFLTSCEDDGGADGFDIEVFPELESDGAFVRFTDEEPFPAAVSFAEPENAGVSKPIDTYNNSTVSYTLDLEATVGSSTYIADDFLTIDSFPNTLEITAQQIADALDLELDDLSFGDSFQFIATAINEDGEESVGVLPGLDDDGFPNGGTLNDPLLNTATYNSAMAFNFTFACPEFPLEELVGSYNVTTNLLAGGLGLSDPDPTREIILGPGDNQVTVVGGSVGFAGGDDLILNVDAASGGLTLGQDEDGNVGLAFPASILGFASDYAPFAGGALALTCVDPPQLTIPVTLTCCGGIWTLVLEKQ